MVSRSRSPMARVTHHVHASHACHKVLTMEILPYSTSHHISTHIWSIEDSSPCHFSPFTHCKVPTHRSILSNLQTLHFAEFHLHCTAVVVNITSMETSPCFAGTFQGFKFHHGLNNRVPLKTNNPFNGPNNRANFVHNLNIDWKFCIENRNQQNVVGRQLLVLSLQKLPQIWIIIVTPSPMPVVVIVKISSRFLVRGSMSLSIHFLLLLGKL